MMLETSVYSIKGTNEPEIGSVTGEKYENSEGRCDMICLDKGICTLVCPFQDGRECEQESMRGGFLDVIAL